MKQPELGQKITELRKSKNLTQEELVEACNVSVRTIQRIESGEVIPRISTIKIILAALGEDLSLLKSSSNTDEELNRAENMLQLAWIAGIIYFIIGFLETGLDYIRFEEGDSDISFLFYISVKSVSFVSYALFLGGFIRLGEFFNNTLLKISSFFMIALFGLIVAFDIGSLFIYVPDELLIGILPAQSISFGAVGIVFGIGLIRLQDGMGRSAMLAGVFEIVVGFCLLTVLLAILGLIIQIPALIIEIIILYKGFEFVRSEQRKLVEV